MLSINCFDTKLAYAEDANNNVVEEGVYIGEEQVREYMESRGMEYNPAVFAIYTNIMETQSVVQPRANINLDAEFVIRNPNNYRYIDTTDALEDSTRPAGQVTINTGYTKNITFSVETTDARYALELLLGFSFSESRTVSVEWSEYCDMAVRLIVYPVYQVYSGELWEEDVWLDDDWGYFEVQEPVGTELWVLRPGDEVICSEGE